MIIFCASDAGPAKYLAHLIKKLDFPAIVFGSDVSIPVFLKSGIHAIPFEPGLINSSVCCAVLGTTLSRTPEKEIIQLSKKYFFCSIAVVDHWTNYVARFRCGDYVSYPDHIFVNDSIAKRQAIIEGIPGKLVEVVGNPVLEEKQNECIYYAQPHSSRQLLFISEQLDRNMPDDDTRYLGFNQFDVLDDIVSLAGGNQTIHLKLHPDEDESDYEFYLKSESVALVSNDEMYKKISEYSVIIGMESILLIEFSALGLLTYSYRPNSKRSFIGCEMNWIPNLTFEQLKTLLVDEIYPYDHQRIKPNFEGSLKKIINRIIDIYENSSVHTG